MGLALERLATEWRWARRNLSSRRWRAVLVVSLLAVGLAANVVVFSAADSLVFHRVIYPSSERLIGFGVREAQTGRPIGSFYGLAAFDEWRKQKDLFVGVHAHLAKVIFLTGSGEPELVNAADITPGLVETLGASPRWGRSLGEDDARQLSPQVVLISESLARERFGDPADAVGQTLPTTAEPLLVVGVMPNSFRFPDYVRRIWRALDPRGPLATGYGLSLIGRIQPAIPMASVEKLLESRSMEVLRAGGGRGNVVVRPLPFTSNTASKERRRLMLMLLGAALCLLLLVCANAASVELATALGRARNYAVHLAVGASRGSVVRSALLEGACLVGVALALAFVLARASVDALSQWLPRSLVAGTTNPIDLDERSLLFMGAAAAASWLLTALPVVLYASRTDLLAVLKMEGAASAASPAGTRMRRAATVVQVALAVLLLVGSVIYVRSYLALLKVDKGFDSSGVLSISLTIPPQRLGTAWDRHRLAEEILQRLRARPGVVAAFEGSPPPATGDSPTLIERLEVDDRPAFETDLLFPRLWITADYFKTLGIPLLEGRMLTPDDPSTNVLITEALARRLWPGTPAVGHRFRPGSPGSPWHEIVGVVGHVRNPQDGVAGPQRHFQMYSAQPRPKPPASAPKPRGNYALPSYGFLTITARVDSRDRTSDLYQTVRAVDTSNILKLEFADDLYAREHADRLLAARIISGFGITTFVIAAGGIYGLMVFLVAARTREIGIRMALGADAAAIRRLVLGTSLKLVAVGVAVGLLAVWVASRWVQAQLYGISAADPLSIAAVVMAVSTVGILATWRPSRTAARIDPLTALRQHC